MAQFPLWRRRSASAERNLVRLVAFGQNLSPRVWGCARLFVIIELEAVSIDRDRARGAAAATTPLSELIGRTNWRRPGALEVGVTKAPSSSYRLNRRASPRAGIGFASRLARAQASATKAQRPASELRATRAG